MKTFFWGRVKSLKYSLRGVFTILKTKDSIITQFIICLVLINMGLYFDISRISWVIQLLLIGIVLSTKGMNKAIEKICDFIHPNVHSRIGFIKDVAAVWFVVSSSLSL